MKYYYPAIVLLFILFGCDSGSDDDANQPVDFLESLGGEKNAITLRVNGSDFKAIGQSASARLVEIDNKPFTLTIEGVSTNRSITEKVSVNIYNVDWDSIQDGDEFIGVFPRNVAIGIYNYSNEDQLIESQSLYDETTKLKIYKIDKSKNLISGTFSFTAVNSNDLNDTYTITEGIFIEIEIK